MSKERKIQKRVNGGFAIYYGMSSALFSVGSLIGLFVWMYKVFVGKTDFSWVIPIMLVIVIAVAGFVGYLLLRVGYEEIED